MISKTRQKSSKTAALWPVTRCQLWRLWPITAKEGPVSLESRRLFGPVKPFLIHLFFKNGEVYTLKLLVWREPVSIFKNAWIKQLCDEKFEILHCFRVRPWRNGPQDPFNDADQASRSFCNADVFCGGVYSIQKTIDGAIVSILSPKADSRILASLWKMIFARGLTISVFGKWSLRHCFIIRLKWQYLIISCRHVLQLHASFAELHRTRRKVDQAHLYTRSVSKLYICDRMFSTGNDSNAAEIVWRYFFIRDSTIKNN